jgi:kumamolisin
VVRSGGEPISRRTYLSRAEFARAHGARDDDVRLVREFAGRNGLEVRGVETARRVARLAGTAVALADAFGVGLRRYEHPRGAYRGQVGPIRLPPELKGVVEGVFGLDSRPMLRAHFRRALDPQAAGYRVVTVASAYSFPAAYTGAGLSVGLLEFGGGYSDADLQQFFSSNGVRPPTVVPVGVDGSTNAPTGDPNGSDGEVELDVEITGALAPGATIVVYFAPNTEQGFVDALTSAVHDATRAPSVISISWGGPEASWTAEARAALETAAQDGAVQGVTVLAAAGDQGASDGEPAGTLAVDFPASSPYVLGCGGTRLVLDGTTIRSEVVWNELSAGEGATGGGVSEDFPLPTYQVGAKVPPAPNGFSGRGVPDVAGDADPETGYAVVVDGAPAEIGGTSAVAPLWAALLARLGQALGKPIGYANPLLYAAPAGAGFRAIISGNNDGYAAGPGWNPCTGLGSPNGTGLLAALRG